MPKHTKPPIKTYTNESISELGDLTFRGVERECTVLAHTKNIFISNSCTIEIDNQRYVVSAASVYIKHKRTGRNKPFLNLEHTENKLPTTVPIQTQLNFFAKKPSQTHRISSIAQMLIERDTVDRNSLARLQGRSFTSVRFDEYVHLEGSWNAHYQPDTPHTRAYNHAQAESERRQRLAEGYGMGETRRSAIIYPERPLGVLPQDWFDHITGGGRP